MPRASSVLDPETMSDQDLTDLTAIPEAPANPLVPADGEWNRRTMKRFLDSCPTRMVHIPRDSGDKPSQKAIHRVIYQGFNYPVEKGKSVAVPEPIAKIVDELDEGKLRTSQARNQAAFLNDVTSDEGAELALGR